MGVNKIPPKLKKYSKQLNTYTGICSVCTRLELPTDSPTNSIMVNKYAKCLYNNTLCFNVRKSLLSCKYFSPVKEKTTVETLLNIFKSLLKSFKKNDWKYLKEAIDHELQN